MSLLRVSIEIDVSYISIRLNYKAIQSYNTASTYDHDTPSKLMLVLLSVDMYITEEIER